MPKQRYYAWQCASACLAACLASLIGLLFLRMGLSVPYRGIGLLCVMLAAIGLIPAILPDRFQSAPLWRTTGMLAGILLVFTAYRTWLLPLSLYLLIIAIGLYQFTRQKIYQKKELRFALLAGFIFGLYILLKSHAVHIAGAFTPELSLMGIQHRDTLLHAAFTNMIGRYGSFSIGSGSLAADPYHIGFHTWLAAIDRYSGLGPIISMPYVIRLVMAPLLLLAILHSVIFQRSGALMTGLLTFIICASELLGMYSNWLSESHLLSLVFLFLALSLLPVFAPCGLQENASPRMRYASFAVFCTAGFCCLAAKLTVGVLLAGMAGLCALLTHRLGAITWLAGIYTLLCAWYVTQYQLPSYTQESFSPFFFLEQFGPFITLSSLLPLLLLWFFQRRITILPKAIMMSLYVVAAVAIAIPNLMLIIGGSGWYFQDVARWVGIWGLLLWISSAYALTRWPVDDANAFWVWVRTHPHKPYFMLIIFAALAFSEAAEGVVTTTAQARLYAAQLLPEEEVFAHSFNLLGDHVISASEKGYGAQLLRAGQDAISDTDGDGRTAIYIPRTSAFWQWPEECNGFAGAFSRTQGFFFQAMLGLPILNPVPYDRHECGHRDSEFIFSHRPLSGIRRETPKALCHAADKHGFTRILWLIDGPPVRMARFDCRIYAGR